MQALPAASAAATCQASRTIGVVEESGSLEPVHQTPFALRAASGLDGPLDVPDVRVGHLGIALLGGQVLDLDRLC
jgi:hypothetical protein